MLITVSFVGVCCKGSASWLIAWRCCWCMGHCKRWFGFPAWYAALGGNVPVALKVVFKCSGYASLYIRWSISENTALSNLSALDSSLYCLRILCHCVFIGANTPTSRGWSACVVLGGRTRWPPRSLASLAKDRLMWEWWPSNSRITFPVANSSATPGRKDFKNQLENVLFPSSRIHWPHIRRPIHGVFLEYILSLIQNEG